MTDFKRFDRELEDFRDAVANANLTMAGAVIRYAAMMDSIDTAFLLYWDDMPPDEQAKMLAAFEKLASTVDIIKGEQGKHG